MANRYWVGGTGSWNGTAGTKWSTTSGGAGGSALPTAADDVYIDAVSGAATVTVSAAGMVCRSLNFVDGTGGAFVGTFHFNTTQVLTIGDATAGAGNVALKLSASATYTYNGTVSGHAFASTSATQQTITSNGKALGLITINGSGSSYVLADAVTSLATFTLEAGTFNTGNYSMSVLSINYGNATARTLTLGSSAITTTASGNNFTGTAVTNLAVTANTAIITCSGALVSTNNVFSLGNKDWNGLSFVVTGGGQGSFNIGGTAARIKDLTVTAPANQTNSYRLTNYAGTWTLTGTLTITGNSAINRVLIYGQTNGTQNGISAATTSLTNVDFMDTLGTGAAAWTGTTVGDRQGNSGITFTTPATQTRDSTNGQAWSVAARWTSRVPLPQDDVIINGSSGNISATDVLAMGKSLDFTGYTGTLTHTSNNNNYSIFGDMILSSGMSFGAAANTFNLDLRGRGSHVLTSNGKVYFPFSSNGTTTIAAPGGTYTLTDTLSMPPGLSVGNYTFSVSAGTFDSANQMMNVGRLTNSGAITRSVILGTSTINLMATAASAILANVSTGLTFSGANAVFNIVNSSVNQRTVDVASGQTIGTLNYTLAGSTGQLNLTSSGAINTLNFSDANNTRILQLSAGVTITCYNFNVLGTSGKLMTVKSASTTPAYLSKPNGGTLYNASQAYVAYEYIQVNQPQSLWLGTGSTVLSCNGIYASEPTYQTVQSIAAPAVSGTSITGTFATPTTPGNLLIAYFTSSNSQGAYTPPTGWTQAVSSTLNVWSYIYYKIADGTETNVVFSQTTSRTFNVTLVEYAGFDGIPTLDVIDANSAGGSVTSLSTTAATGPTNTDQPALAVAMLSNASTLSSTVSLTNDFIEDRTLVLASSQYKGAVKELTTTAPVDTTFTWTTARTNSATALAVFKDVPIVAASTGSFFEVF